MFIGSINQYTRDILGEMAGGWQNKPIYVGCSGNFTVERILNKINSFQIHSNEVSLYSCALGSYLSGETMKVGINDEKYLWLEKYLEPGLPILATLILCTEMLKFTDRPEPYYQRMARAYHARFKEMHELQINKINKALDGVRVNSFYAGDVLDFALNAPTDCVFISFPPTYKGGYERLYRKINEVFNWNKPVYKNFDDDSFREFVDIIQSKSCWVTLRDYPVDDLRDYCIGVVQTGIRSKPVYIYSNSSNKSRLILTSQKIEPVTIKRLSGQISGDISIKRLSAGQLNFLRSQYLSSSIIPAGAQLNLAVLAGDELIGVIAFSRSNYLGNWCDAYMMTDFAISPTIYKRLSKLVLAAVLSIETKIVLEQTLNMRVGVIGTTAFTKKPVSMKYRGLFEVFNRKDDRLNYISSAGKWTLREALDWWMKTQSQKLIN